MNLSRLKKDEDVDLKEVQYLVTETVQKSGDILAQKKYRSTL